MNHFGKGLREDKFHCALKGINVMMMPLLMARSTHRSTLEERQARFLGQGSSQGMLSFAKAS